MPVEFLGIAATNDGSEISARDRGQPSTRTTRCGSRGRTRRTAGTGSCSPTGRARPTRTSAAAYIASKTETLQLLLAHRPNVSYPTFAAKTFATVDQVSGGRVTVHFITGGTDHEQQREGDYLTKDERYERTRECMADRQAGVDLAGAVRPRGQRTTSSPTSSATSSRCSSRGPGCRSAARRPPPTRPAAPRPTSTACGASRWRRRPSRSSRSGRRPRRPGAPTCPRSRSPSARSSRPTEAKAWEKAHDIVRPHRGAGRGGRRRAQPAPPGQQPGEHRVAAADRDRRGGRAVRPRAVDPHRGRHRRRGQLQRAGRHAGNRRAGDPRLHRPRRRHHLDARLRPARRRDRRRPAGDPDRPRRRRQARRSAGGDEREHVTPASLGRNGRKAWPGSRRILEFLTVAELR